MTYNSIYVSDRCMDACLGEMVFGETLDTFF